MEASPGSTREDLQASSFRSGAVWGASCAVLAVALLISVVFFVPSNLFSSSTKFHSAHAENVVLQTGYVQEFARPLKVLKKPLVILVASDGFRWGFQFKVATPNIDRLRLNGTETEDGMFPSYPSMTFPNHYTLATDLYPAWHGIISNDFSNPENTSDKFTTSNTDPKWWIGEPIWETVVKNGLKAAAYMWAGSAVVRPYWNCAPNACVHYNENIPFKQRVDSVLGYVDLPESERPDFICLYLDEPDRQGHEFGADAPQVTEAVAKVDATLGQLIDGLEKRKIFEDVTLIMVGDHGMLGTCEKKRIFLEDLAPWVNISSSWVDYAGAMLTVIPPQGIHPKDIVDKMKEGLASGKVTNAKFLKVYLKDDLPKRLHYYGSNRIQPIIGMVSEGYSVELKRSPQEEEACGGKHGYDNKYASMRTIFFAHGPRFARGRKVPSFYNVEVYNVITEILGIKGASTNGTKSFRRTILLPKRKSVGSVLCINVHWRSLSSHHPSSFANKVPKL